MRVMPVDAVRQESLYPCQVLVMSLSGDEHTVSMYIPAALHSLSIRVSLMSLSRLRIVNILHTQVHFLTVSLLHNLFNVEPHFDCEVDC
jgi:hypothetical protein